MRSRRDLVGKVFFAWYEPRVRDNERRASASQPLRGGPLDGHEIVVPGLTAALIVFHGDDFHRYSIAASGGQVGTAVPLAYDTPVPPSIAGYH